MMSGDDARLLPLTSTSTCGVGRTYGLLRGWESKVQYRADASLLAFNETPAKQHFLKFSLLAERKHYVY